MTIPQISLLAFAMWTIVVPLGAIAYYRWSRIIAGAATINAFSADAVTGPDWYRRAMRAHANCVENLPVFASIVLLLSLCGVQSSFVDALALAVLIARLAQSSVHLGWAESVRAVSVRFLCFAIQVICMLGLALDGVVSDGVRSAGH